MNQLDEIYNNYLSIADALDEIDETLSDVDTSELMEKGLELIHTAGQFSKALHAIIMEYDPIFNEYSPHATTFETVMEAVNELRGVLDDWARRDREE
jgi:hypothetical protein